jgi:4-hydroxy-2-oxoheptanedioate aldolase
MTMERLNSAIRTLEAGMPIFAPMDTLEVTKAVSLASSSQDAAVFDMEHGHFSVPDLARCLQFMLNPRQIVERGTVAPKVAPFVRLAANGSELNHWMAKQILDVGAYGLVWPHVSTVAEARNAISASRYPRAESDERYSPAGVRGYGPWAAARYWGLPLDEYCARADVWPYAPDGEILVVIMCEELVAVKNLPDILESVPGIGVVWIGLSDLAQDLGHTGERDHPQVLELAHEALDICKSVGIACGKGDVNLENVEETVERGWKWLLSSERGDRWEQTMEAGRRAAKRLL